MPTASMTASVKSKPPSQIWTCPKFPLMPRLRPQPVLQILKVWMSCSRTTLLLMLKVMEGLLKMIRPNPSRMRLVLLKRPRQIIRRRTERPLLISSRFFFEFFFLILGLLDVNVCPSWACYLLSSYSLLIFLFIYLWVVS